MDIKELIQRQLAAAHRQIDLAMQGTTEEQFNWTPSGTANPISATFLHITGGEDIFIHHLLLDKPRVWEMGAWTDKVGVPSPPGRAYGWEEFRGKQLSIAPMLAYQQAVRDATDAYLAALTADEFDRPVRFFDGNERPLAEILVTLVVHSASHAGEIAALKGAQGGQGLPF